MTRQHELGSFHSPAHFAQGQLNGKVMHKKPFLLTHHKQSHLRYAKACLDTPKSF